MTEKKFNIRGHHLYQLYKAHQLKNRGVWGAWDFIAKNFLCSIPGVSWLEVSDKVFGDSPEKVKHIKSALNDILENQNTKIIFTNNRVEDTLCGNCPDNCSLDGTYSAQDDFVLIAANLETEKPYSLGELSKIFSKRGDGWAREYEKASFDICTYFGNDWNSSILGLKRKGKEIKKLKQN